MTGKCDDSNAHSSEKIWEMQKGGKIKKNISIFQSARCPQTIIHSILMHIIFLLVVIILQLLHNS